MYKNIFFDLNGALCNNLQGVNNALLYALEQESVSLPKGFRVHQLIGKSLRTSLKAHFQFTDSVLEIVIQHFRNYYCRIGMYESFLYEGIESMLFRLFPHAHLHAITTMPTIFAKELLNYHNVYQYFTSIQGMELREKQFNKLEIIANIVNQENAILIGDMQNNFAMNDLPHFHLTQLDFIKGDTPNWSQISCFFNNTFELESFLMSAIRNSESYNSSVI